jgi:hypothetical protein
MRVVEQHDLSNAEINELAKFIIMEGDQPALQEPKQWSADFIDF